MAQVVVRNLEENVKAQLKKRALQHGWSMEEEVRQILRKAIDKQEQTSVRLGSRIAARFTGLGLTSELPQLQAQTIAPMDFGS